MNGDFSTEPPVLYLQKNSKGTAALNTDSYALTMILGLPAMYWYAPYYHPGLGETKDPTERQLGTDGVNTSSAFSTRSPMTA